MMTKIDDNFCGYVKIGNDTFTYNVSNHMVTLLPAQSKQTKIYEVLERIRSYNIDTSEYLFGVSNNNNRIAMLRNGQFSIGSFGLNSSIHFGTPIIIKASGNTAYFNNMLTTEWNKFHAITFCGGNINSLCNPQMAVETPTLDEYNKTSNHGARVIKIRPWNEYTRSIDFVIDGEKVTLIISVSQAGDANNSEDMESYGLGKLDTFIRLSFNNAQSFDQIAKYYGMVKSLTAILTKRNNIFFEVYLSQRNSDNLYFKTGICKIYDHYENYSALKWHNVIPIYRILDCVPKLIDKISNNEVESLLALLSEDNRRANQISITNVQDLCTALEVAYNWSKTSKEKDPLITELKKNIKKTISEFASTHDEIDVDKETTISSSFQYLDYTLKQKILLMYNENCDAVDAIISKRLLPQVDESNVGSFLKLRNSKTHTGTFEWGDSANLYPVLLALEYACLLRYIGVPNETIKTILLDIF